MNSNDTVELNNSELDFLQDNWCSEESFYEADEIYNADYKTQPLPAAQFFNKFYGNPVETLNEYKEFIGNEYSSDLMLISILNYKGEINVELAIYDEEKHGDMQIFNGKYDYS